MSVLGDKEYEGFIKNDYLPFYNGLNEKEKTFWLECTKEELIDHLIANIKNGEKLLKRIELAKEYINSFEYYIPEDNKPELYEILNGELNEKIKDYRRRLDMEGIDYE